MIPVNCFFDNGQFLFFDQEFVSGNYPASYVMFRALNDTYYFSPVTERSVPLSEMKRRYGLSELWPVFIREENRFQDRLRRRERHSQLYKWMSFDKKSIARNGRLLLMDKKPEEINTPVPDRVFAPVDGAETQTIVLFGAGK